MEGESRGLTPSERGTRGWRRGGQGGDGGRKTAAGEGRREKEGRGKEKRNKTEWGGVGRKAEWRGILYAE